jgi:flagellar motor switch protein FliN
MSDPVDYVPFETTTTPQPGAATGDPAELERLYEVPVELAVEIGRTHMTIRETLALGPGSIVTLNRLAGEPVDLLVNGKPIARGEVVVIDEEFGLRVTEVVTSPHEGDGSRAAAPSPGGSVAGVTGESRIAGVPSASPVG